MSIQEIQKLAEHCNDKKLAAKTVSEGSDDTFFGLFVRVFVNLNFISHNLRLVVPLMSEE